MKRFIEVSFDPPQCRRELTEFGDLLRSRADLRERSEIQKFFRERKQLSSFLGTYAPQVGPANLLAFEFSIFGDFAADVVLGNPWRRTATRQSDHREQIKGRIFERKSGKHDLALRVQGRGKCAWMFDSRRIIQITGTTQTIVNLNQIANKH
jgi:hypothetical protein